MYLWKSLLSNPHQAVADGDEVSASPSLLWAEQTQLAQPLLVCPVLQPRSFWWPLLDSLDLHWKPKQPSTAGGVSPLQKKGKDPLPCHAGYTLANAAFVGHGVDSCLTCPPAAPGAFSAKLPVYPVVLGYSLLGQDFAFAFVGLCKVPNSPFLQPGKVPVDSSPVLQRTNRSPQIMGKALQSLCCQGEWFYSAIATRTLVCFHAI